MSLLFNMLHRSSFSVSWDFPIAQMAKNLPAVQETLAQSLGWEDPLEEGKATRSSSLAWRIPGGLQSMGSQRIEQD